MSTTVRNKVATDLTDDITAISLHDGSPGVAGTDNEISGNGYARLAPSFSAPSDGVTNLSAPLEFDGPANQQVTHYGVWAGATFLYSRLTNPSPANFNSDGRLNLNTVPVNVGSS